MPRGNEPLVAAGVDLGANSVHLLVAAVIGHRLTPLVDESVFLGLGDRVASAGTIGPAKREALVAALVGYAETARRLGAERIAFVGTEPLRRAGDTARLVEETARTTGVPLHVLGHAEEGALTLIGVTAGSPVEVELAVADVGGGSSEIVEVGAGRAPVAIGLRLGSARLTVVHAVGDPPAAAEVEAMRTEARARLRAVPDLRPGELVAVGGTASNLLKVIPGAAIDRRLDRRRLATALELLLAEPAAAAAERHAVNLIRARQLPAGAIILEAMLERFGLAELRVSEAGVREGLVLALARSGMGWRDRLATLARGWPDEPDA